MASQFLSLRVIDKAGKPLLDERIDAAGTLPPLRWSRCQFNLATPHDPAIASVQFYVQASNENAPWDERLQISLNNLQFGIGD